jgi:sec-independent protein translocase protein TatA
MINIAFMQPGPFEIIVILFIILLLFGAKRLPGLARSLGKSLQEFKRGKDEVMRELTSADDDIDTSPRRYQDDIESESDYVKQADETAAAEQTEDKNKA